MEPAPQIGRPGPPPRERRFKGKLCPVSLALPVDVVEGLHAFAEQVRMPKVAVVELALRRLLTSEGR